MRVESGSATGKASRGPALTGPEKLILAFAVFKSKDPRPSHVLSEWLTDIQRFLVERLNERLIPIPAGMLTDIDEDVTML